MAQQIINDGESGLNVRTALNDNFTELYGALVLPLKLAGINANTLQAIPANSYVGDIFLSTVSGAPTLRIGTTPNGTDIMPDTLIGAFSQLSLQEYFAGATTFYITISGGGSVNIRFNILYNFY